jgi:hypothetical protein
LIPATANPNRNPTTNTKTSNATSPNSPASRF